MCVFKICWKTLRDNAKIVYSRCYNIKLLAFNYSSIYFVV